MLFITISINLSKQFCVIRKFQYNSAARLILRRPCSDSARPLLPELHWLSVARTVDFKILVLTYKVMHDEAPVCLCELVRPYQPARALRSVSSNSLEVKRTHSNLIMTIRVILFMIFNNILPINVIT